MNDGQYEIFSSWWRDRRRIEELRGVACEADEKRGSPHEPVRSDADFTILFNPTVVGEESPMSFDPITTVLNQINAEISNRLVLLQDLKIRAMVIEGEIMGLREAQSRLESANKEPVNKGG